MVKINLIISILISCLFAEDISLKLEQSKFLKNEPIYLKIEKSESVLKILNIDTPKNYIVKDDYILLTSDKNLTIKPMEFEYLSKETNRIEKLKTKEINITIEEDLDLIDSLLDSEFDIKLYLDFIYQNYLYFIIFILGFIFGKITKFRRKEKVLTDLDLIKRAKTKKELYRLLLKNQSDLKILDILENIEKNFLSKTKREVINYLKELEVEKLQKA